ncbi:type IV toxin-antitoxin system AbiEi family antitoxin domain-containing protein [Nocardiopsis sp. RSe5-2]|uniref:Type IV toxin-antitoxin system AbiEi family antitoxin domain-containing protein n=1 Tax=Nocardiopsis endophytica TaxID=3018445 RepID=A0ABT4TXR6_9ACTN|nr:type IV toxin-antitoxin system AbiEi family antitoxin domain-containing protein [Nocardiopsis endophytica]MDA2809491.1 type IV toxin-antitoxin system AbiEi family antitoxin domain-containing protein [Nocardiopsis endophytica]
MAPLRTDLRHAHRTASCQYGLITADQARACGLSRTDIRRLLEARRWRTAFALPGVYCVHPFPPFPAARRAPLLPLFRHAQAAQLALGPRAVASGTTAALLWGLRGLQGLGHPLHFTLPHPPKAVNPAHIRTNTWRIAPREVTVRHGLRITVPERTLRDAVLQSDRDTAVALMDSAVHLGLVSADHLPALEAANAGRPGCRRSREWWPLSDGRAQNPLQTRIRLACTDAGIPPDDLQRPLPLPDGNTAYAHLWWNSGPVAVEAPWSSLTRADCARHKAILDTHPDAHLLRISRRDLPDLDEVVKTISEALR